MRYNLFDGGNFLRRPEDQMLSGYSETYDVEPAGHHKVRYAVLEQHWDTQGRDWRGNWEGLGEKRDQVIVADGDELVSHLLGAGWLIQRIVFHVKRAGSGTFKPVVELLMYDESGNSIDREKIIVVDASGSDLAIDLSKPGFYAGLVVSGGIVSSPLPVLTQTNGYLVQKYTATKNDDDEDMPFDACVGIYLDLVNYYNENPCDCAPTPCPTEFPDPQCMPL